MAASGEAYGDDHPATRGKTPKPGPGRGQLSGEMFGDDPSKGFARTEKPRRPFIHGKRKSKP